MILEVDPADPTPVYEQLRAQIVQMVAAGTLTAGTRLPTIRQLATDLGIAKGTVARAYEALLRDGWSRRPDARAPPSRPIRPTTRLDATPSCAAPPPATPSAPASSE